MRLDTHTFKDRRGRILEQEAFRALRIYDEPLVAHAIHVDQISVLPELNLLYTLGWIERDKS